VHRLYYGVYAGGLERDALLEEVSVLRHRLKLATTINEELHLSNADLEALLHIEVKGNLRLAADSSLKDPSPERGAPEPSFLGGGSRSEGGEGSPTKQAQRSERTPSLSRSPSRANNQSSPSRRGSVTGGEGGGYYSATFKDMAGQVSAASARADTAEDKFQEAEKKRIEMAHDMRLKLSVDAQHSLQLLLAHQQEVYRLSLCLCFSLSWCLGVFSCVGVSVSVWVDVVDSVQMLFADAD